MEKETVSKSRAPTRWATDISAVINQIRGNDHFPLSVPEIAAEFSKMWFPDDPIDQVIGADLPGFDGALVRAPKGRKGWGIFYNDKMRSKGRINFTLAHEFGHYLVHRLKYPNGMKCGQQDIVRWDSEYKRLEYEANKFAAYLLMPFDDYRRQIQADSAVTFDTISACAERYGVSLIAATVRWLEFTSTRAVMVVSRDGYILWAKPSTPAFRSGVYFKTSGAPVEIPSFSLAARQPSDEGCRAGVEMPEGTWLAEPCREMAIFSEHYDFTISLLQLDRRGLHIGVEDPLDGESDEDLGSLIRKNHGI
jgi:hypothetical protein